MKAARLKGFKDRAISFDVETHLIQPGLLAPPMVCGSAGWFGVDKVEGELLDKEQCLNYFVELIRSQYIIVGANIAYDILVMATHAARLGQNLMPDIFRAYDEERVFDVQIAEALHGIANGHLYKDPQTNESVGRYSLDTCVRLVLGRDNAKANDRWRLRYAELEDIPIKDWPQDARDYPVDDAVNTLECAIEQSKTRDNLHDLARQCYSAWALHLGAAWGFQVDPHAIEELEKLVLDTRHKGLQRFIDADFFKLDKQGRPQITPSGAERKNQSLIKRLVAEAYGVTGTCRTCEGSGRVPGRTKCKVCDGFCVVQDGNDRVTSTCNCCGGLGKVPNPKTTRGCPDCDGTGYDLSSAPLPRTEKGAIQAGRDDLRESGDELLINFASFSEQDKIRTTYIPLLKRGIQDGKTVPLNLRPNVLVETGRTSYGDGMHGLPRGGGVRECFVARLGTVLCSCDYGGLELATHAQSCLWLLGFSRLASALNDGLDAHSSFAAGMVGIDYDSFDKSNPKHKAYRQAAKAANFGFPGGMGAPKLVLQQRKHGPDTEGPDGRLYKGLRFCLLIGGESVCGVDKVTEWNGQPLSPTCRRCIECATELRRKWFQQWPENEKYFDHISGLVDRIGYLEQHASKRKRGGVTFTSAANSFFQGLAADGAKHALCQVAREQFVDTSSPLFGSRTILFAHDELVVEMPEGKAHEAAMRLSDLMVASMREFVPDVRVTAEPALMRRWYKGAEPVFDNGRLIPWEP